VVNLAVCCGGGLPMLRSSEMRAIITTTVALGLAALATSARAQDQNIGRLVCTNANGLAQQVIVDYDAETATLVDGSDPAGSVEVQSAPAKIDDQFVRFQGPGMSGDTPTTYTVDLGGKTLSVHEWALSTHNGPGPGWETTIFKCGDWIVPQQKS
jgi:hypothetical protein